MRGSSWPPRPRRWRPGCGERSPTRSRLGPRRASGRPRTPGSAAPAAGSPRWSELPPDTPNFCTVRANRRPREGQMRKVGITLVAALAVAATGAASASAADVYGPCQTQRNLFQKENIQIEMHQEQVEAAYGFVCSQTG